MCTVQSSEFSVACNALFIGELFPIGLAVFEPILDVSFIIGLVVLAITLCESLPVGMVVFALLLSVTFLVGLTVFSPSLGYSLPVGMVVFETFIGYPFLVGLVVFAPFLGNSVTVVLAVLALILGLLGHAHASNVRLVGAVPMARPTRLFTASLAASDAVFFAWQPAHSVCTFASS